MSRFAFLESEHPLAFAHRGGTNAFPENTLAAFANAVEMGYRYVETDVHVTLDGHLVAFHDPQLDGVSDGRGEIKSLTLAEVTSASILSADGEAHSVPRLAEILGSWPDLRVNIDPKSDRAVEPLTRMIREFKATERVCIGSFADQRIWRCRRALGGDLCTSMGPLEMARLRAGSFRRPGRRIGSYRAGCAQVPEFYRGHKLIDERFMDYASEADLAVHVWTVNTRADMERFLDLGADGLITDQLDVLRCVYTQRNIW